MLRREWGNGLWGLLLGITIPPFPTKHQAVGAGFRGFGVSGVISSLRFRVRFRLGGNVGEAISWW